MSSRASSFARSSPTPQTELTGAASCETVGSGKDIGCKIQTAAANLNHRDCRTTTAIWFSIFIQFKNLLDGFLEQAGDLERQRQTRIVFLRLDRVHRLARDIKFVGQIGLRPCLRRA